MQRFAVRNSMVHFLQTAFERRFDKSYNPPPQVSSLEPSESLLYRTCAKRSSSALFWDTASEDLLVLVLYFRSVSYIRMLSFLLYLAAANPLKSTTMEKLLSLSAHHTLIEGLYGYNLPQTYPFLET